MADRIPIKRAEEIAKAHGYEQVIVYARRVGEPGLEWVTTYGVDPTHCAAAARIGDAIGRQVVRPLEDMRALIARFTEALTPSGDTKAAYHGEFYFEIEDRDEDGEECLRRICVPWTTVKEIMAAIHGRAAKSREVRQ